MTYMRIQPGLTSENVAERSSIIHFIRQARLCFTWCRVTNLLRLCPISALALHQMKSIGT